MLKKLLPQARLIGVVKVFGVAFREYKMFGIVLFVTSLAATFLEIISYGVIVTGISVLSSSGDSTVSQLPFLGDDFVPTEKDALFAIIAAGLALILSAGLFYLSAVVMARCRGRAFEDMINRTVNSLRKRPNHPFVHRDGLKGMSRVLRRDCRYAAIAITDAISLPRHLLVCFGLLVVSIFAFPGLALIAISAILLAAFIQTLVGSSGISGMDDLLSFAAEKSKADRDLIMKLQSSPYYANRGVEGPYDHASSPQVRGYIDAYQRRVKLAPASDLASRIIFIISLIAVGAYLAILFIRGDIGVATIVAIILAMRLFGQSIMAIAQIVVLIFSYAPLMGDLLQFLEGKSSKSQLPPVKLENRMNGDEQSKLVRHSTVIGDVGLSFFLATQINTHLPQPERRVRIVAPYAPPPEMEIDYENLAKVLDEAWPDLPEETVKALQGAARRRGVFPDHILALLSFILNEDTQDQANIVWDAKSFLRLKPDEQTLVIAYLHKRSLCIYYNGFPRQLPARFTKRTYLLQSGRIEQVKNPAEFEAIKKRRLVEQAVAIGIGSDDDDENEI